MEGGEKAAYPSKMGVTGTDLPSDLSKGLQRECGKLFQFSKRPMSVGGLLYTVASERLWMEPVGLLMVHR